MQKLLIYLINKIHLYILNDKIKAHDQKIAILNQKQKQILRYLEQEFDENFD